MVCGGNPHHVVGGKERRREMIGVSAERDSVDLKLMRRAGLDPAKYIAVKSKVTYLDALNWKTGEIVRISKTDASIM